MSQLPLKWSKPAVSQSIKPTDANAMVPFGHVDLSDEDDEDTAYEVEEVKSKPSKSLRASGSIVAKQTFLARDTTVKPSTNQTFLARDQSSRPNANTTFLARDQSSRPIANTTFLARDQSSRPIANATLLTRDMTVRAVLISTRPIDIAPKGVKSVFTRPEDEEMGKKQLEYDNLNEDEQEKQEDWAHRMIKKIGNCPEGYDWERRTNGYQCARGGHGVTDQLLAAGKGGILAFKGTKDWENAKDWEGAYFPSGKSKEGKQMYVKGVITEEDKAIAMAALEEDSDDDY